MQKLLKIAKVSFVKLDFGFDTSGPPKTIDNINASDKGLS